MDLDLHRHHLLFILLTLLPVLIVVLLLVLVPRHHPLFSMLTQRPVLATHLSGQLLTGHALLQGHIHLLGMQGRYQRKLAIQAQSLPLRRSIRVILPVLQETLGLLILPTVMVDIRQDTHLIAQVIVLVVNGHRINGLLLIGK